MAIREFNEILESAIAIGYSLKPCKIIKLIAAIIVRDIVTETG
ncbi:hypothetical protein [Vacuolonema iberomarrocanum]